MATVYVIMGNDFPDRVFEDRAMADAYVASKKAEFKPNQGHRMIYWRVNEFEVVPAEKKS